MVPGEPSRRRSGRSQEAFGDGRPRGMAITASVVCGRGRTEPGLHAVWHRPGRETFRPGDDSADQAGISAVSRGQACGLRILSLPAEIDRLAWLTVWSRRRVSRPWPADQGLRGGTGNGRATHRGKVRAILGIARSFFARHNSHSYAINLAFLSRGKRKWHVTQIR